MWEKYVGEWLPLIFRYNELFVVFSVVYATRNPIFVEVRTILEFCIIWSKVFLLIWQSFISIIALAVHWSYILCYIIQNSATTSLYIFNICVKWGCARVTKKVNKIKKMKAKGCKGYVWMADVLFNCNNNCSKGNTYCCYLVLVSNL